MLGVLKRRWKPKRVSSNNNHHHNNQNGRLVDATGAGEGRASPSARQIHPVYGEKAQLLAYEAEAQIHSKAVSSPTETLSSTARSTPCSTPCSNSPAPHPLLVPAYPLAPNICVEGGRIEFIRPSVEGTPIDEKARATSVVTRCPGTVSRAQQTAPLENNVHSEEKCDLAKENLEARVADLEALLDTERRSCERERACVQRLQRQLAKREAAQRHVDRERFLRLDSAAEAERCRARLAALQRDLTRMEEALRCMLQYKSRCAQLKQDKTALIAAYEIRIQQFQSTIGKLTYENEALKKQVRNLEAQGGVAVQAALLERLRALEADNTLLSRDSEQQRRQYERCLDDVANQVVRALLSQKGLREQISGLQKRIRELETQNRALTALLVQQMHTKRQLTEANSLLDGEESADALTTFISVGTTEDVTALSKPRLRRHRTLGDAVGGLIVPGASLGVGDDPPALLSALWLQRPHSLNLVAGEEGQHTQQHHAVAELQRASQSAVRQVAEQLDPPTRGQFTTDECVTAVVEAVHEDEGSSSPESGNRDEGYSTMSSDVQVEAVRLRDVGTASSGTCIAYTGGHPVLEDVKESSDETEAVVVESHKNNNMNGRRLVLLDVALSTRHSYPPVRDILPHHHVMRSFSDSHLCLKLSSHAQGGFTVASSPAISPPALVLDVSDKQRHALRRARATRLLAASPLSEEDEEGQDADYVQHWLRLDETRSALQQQHREALELEYDQAEMEDWSLSLSYEDLAWRRAAAQATTGLPTDPKLLSIQENNTLELEEDSNECLWNNASYMETHHKNIGWPYADMNSSMTVNAVSPGGSWSSSDCCGSNDCCFNGCHTFEDRSSKRSSVTLSGFSDECASGESPTVGTDFTRDFYRLVKFESTKSLASASNSSNCGKPGQDAPVDREQALQSVLSFIVEQQKYCYSREEEDSRPVSHNLDDEASFLSSKDSHLLMTEASVDLSKDDARDDHSLLVQDDTKCMLATKEDIPADQVQLLDAEPIIQESVDSAMHTKPEENSGISGKVNTDISDVKENFSECAFAGASGQGDRKSAFRLVIDTAAVRLRAEEASFCSLRTVVEEEEIDTTAAPEGDSCTHPISSSDTVLDHSSQAGTNAYVNFQDHATSKDVIDELNRMIRKGEETATEVDVQAAHHESVASIDSTCCCPTGWVHVERDIDFTDPKARANLLDVMLASSGSSGSMSSSSSDSGEEPGDYRHLHRLHRFRRHKKASAFREPFGVIRFPTCSIRQSIIGRDDFFVRYGDKEREAMSSFDFLDEMSTPSISGASSTQKLDSSPPEEGRETPIPDLSADPNTSGGSRNGSESLSVDGSLAGIRSRPPSSGSFKEQHSLWPQ